MSDIRLKHLMVIIENFVNDGRSCPGNQRYRELKGNLTLSRSRKEYCNRKKLLI